MSDKKFCCDVCNYYTNNSFDYNKHLSTNKHKKIKILQKSNKNIIGTYKCICGDEFNNRTTLWRHEKKNNCIKYESNNDKNLITILHKENQEIIKILLEKLESNNKILEILDKTS